MLRAIIALPFLIVLTLFALSNTDTVSLRFWPTDYSLPAPVSIAILVAAAVGFLLGAILLWFSAASARMKLRRAERDKRDLEDRLREANARFVDRGASRAISTTPGMAPAILPPAAQSRVPAISR